MKKSKAYLSNNHPGDIIITKYRDLSGVEKKGLFCILYLERFDNNTECANNIICAKVTSKCHGKYSYYVDLKKGDGGIMTDSKICPTKLYLIKWEDVIDKLNTCFAN